MRARQPLIAIPLVVASGAAVRTAAAQQLDTAALARAIDAVVTRPELRRGHFGIAVYDLDRKQLVFERFADQLFTPGSTTKLVTVGTALGILGPDYRFHTPIYRIGPVNGGVLRGDLVMVASGDPMMSGRLMNDTVTFSNVDHSYAGVSDTMARSMGDPLAVYRALAAKVRAMGIRRVEGNVWIDASLFPSGERELGTRAVLSPAIINDNFVDIVVRPGARIGDPILITATPDIRFFTLEGKPGRIRSTATTGAPGSPITLDWDWARDSLGEHILVEGSYPLGRPPALLPQTMDNPTDFAEQALRALLRESGIEIAGSAGQRPRFGQLRSVYGDSVRVAEHVSPPLSEWAKVTLKVSQNLWASSMPYILGAAAGNSRGPRALAAGWELQRSYLERAGLDLMAASQGDGAGGSPAAFYSPSFMVRFLAHMASTKDSATFVRALPVLGRDGTLWNIQPDSPAAGKVYAKTGTFRVFDPMNRRTIVLGKALAGYTTTASGQRLAIAVFANRIPFASGYPGDATLVVGQAVGEIAAAIWQSGTRR